MLTSRDIDTFIDTAIDRFSGDTMREVSKFHVDLREYQQRITSNLVNNCIDVCESRGLKAERNGDSLVVTVKLDSCFFSVTQANRYRNVLDYARRVHGYEG